MRILCTSPGKFGDLLWSLPTARALAETFETPVNLQIAAEFRSLWPLLKQQPYLDCVFIDPDWHTQDTAPRTPRVPPVLVGEYDHIFHLGYDGWPQRRLAEQVYTQVQDQLGRGPLAPLDLDRPWITIPAEDVAAYHEDRSSLVVGFTEEWIELKVGIILALCHATDEAYQVINLLTPGVSSRWDEWRFSSPVWRLRASWTEAAAIIAAGDLFLGCLSAPWVLANALGKRTLVVEPAKMRWDSPGGWHESIFWRPSAKNRMVLGNDGLPTFDARAVCAAVIEELGPVSPER